MATVREIVTRFGFEVDASQIQKYEKSIANAKSSIFALSATVTAAAGSLFGIAKLTANHGEEASKLSTRLGITAEAYQEMAFAAHLADIGTEELNQSMGFLVRNMGNAKLGGKEAAAGFAAIGGNVAKLVKSGAPADQVMLSIADRFKSIKDPAKRAAIATQLFGRAGARMIPFLSKGSAEMQQAFEKAKQYGLVLDQETIDASNEFNDGLKELIGQGHGLKNIIGAGLVKTIAPLIKQLVHWVDANRELIATNLKDFLSGLVVVVKTAFSVFQKLMNLIIALVKPMGGLGNALKIVVAGFAAFKALQLLTAIGGAAQMVFQLAKGFRMASLMAALMNAQALLIPLLIGAGIAFLLLAIEDVIGFFNGKDSVTAIIVEKFKETWALVTDGARYAFNAIVEDFWGLIDKVKPVFDMLWNLFENSPLGMLYTGTRDLFGSIGSLMTSSVDQQTALPGSGVANQRTLNNSINAPMTFNMGSGVDSKPEAVGSKVYDNLDELMRTSSRNLSSGVAY